MAYTNVQIPSQRDSLSQALEMLDRANFERDLYKKRAESYEKILQNIPAAIKELGYVNISYQNETMTLIEKIKKTCPDTAEVEMIQLFFDGNEACALLGSNLQEGESEFVNPDHAPQIVKEKGLEACSMWAITQAKRRLEERLGYKSPHYEALKKERE